MTPPGCDTPIPLATLLEYWLGELAAADEAAIDGHLLACGACSAALQSVVDIADEVRTAVRVGAVHAVLSDVFVKRLAAQGLRLREYRVAHNGSVLCTVAPQDDLLVAYLDAPLAGVEQLDVEWVGGEGEGIERLSDVPFDAASGELVFVPRMERMRALPEATVRIRLVAVASAGERLVGEYTFHHRPHRPREGG